jgi:hypothetical protein
MSKKSSRTPSLLLALLILPAVLFSACGGGGSGGSSGGPTGSGLAFSTVWEQPPGRTRQPRSFGSEIPPSVETVRITMEPQGPDASPACCIAIRRGSAAFENRSLVLDQIAVGQITLTINGYFDDFAPSDGIDLLCPTAPSDAGQACDPTRTDLPTHGSDPNVVDVAPGVVTDAGDIPIFSLPFLLDRSPDPGEVVLRSRVPVSVRIVDAANPIDEDFEIEILAGEPPTAFAVTISSITPCDETPGGSGPDCTEGGDRQILGFTVEGVSEPVPDGLAQVAVRAANEGSPPRAIATSYTVDVQATTTTTTSSTSSTSSTTSTTNTTIPPCPVTIRIDDDAQVTGLLAEIDYSAADGEFLGAAGDVECTALLGGDAITSINDNDELRTLIVGVASNTPFNGPVNIATCDFTGTPPTAEDFAINVIEADDENFEPTELSLSVTVGACAPRSAE